MTATDQNCLLSQYKLEKMWSGKICRHLGSIRLILLHGLCLTTAEHALPTMSIETAKTKFNTSKTPFAK